MFRSEFTPPYNIGGGGVTEKRGVAKSFKSRQLGRLPHYTTLP